MKSDEKGHYRDLAREKECAGYIERLKVLRATGDLDCDEAQNLEVALLGAVAPGYYEHFKSTEESRKFYYVLGVAPDVNTTDGRSYPVVYSALYGKRKGKLASRQLVDVDSFLRPISRDGYVGPRFRKLSEEEVATFADQLKF